MKKALVGLGGVALVGAVAALTLLVVVHSSGSTSRTVTQQNGEASGEGAVNASQPADSPGGTREGIVVHGHWTIEVHEQGGALVQRREFENSLMTNASHDLAEVLAHQNSVGFWEVIFGGPAEACSDGTNPMRCILYETGASDPPPSPDYFKTLTVDAPTSGPNTGKFVLTGNATPTLGGGINFVATVISICPYGSATPCGSYTDYFTSTFLASPIAVSAGQQVLVTVVISFS